MKDLGIVELLSLAGFDASRPTKIVRHQQQQYPVDELLRTGWLELYQGYQSKPVFHEVDQVVSCSGLSGSRARLLGVYAKEGTTTALKGPAPKTCPWVQEWRRHCKHFYRLVRVSGYEALERRVIIHWGPGALAWHQKLSSKKNKRVLAIEPAGRVLPLFEDYLEFSLTHRELVELVANAQAHPEWLAHLKAVAGVYMILATTTGEQYVGSAAGAEGVWGRWSAYAANGHGSNVQLRELIERDPRYPEAFQYSLLQVLPKTMTLEEVLGRESSYKSKLGSRAHGLNLN